MKAHKVHIETFGCQMNEYDSELVRSLLRKAGFEFTEDRERADVMLMNTCAIRENAHNKVFGHLSELKTVKEQRPLVVGVLGCMAQNLKEELTERQPLVDVLVGPDGYRQLPVLLAKALESEEQGHAQRGLAVDLSEYETYDDVLPERDGGMNAWIAIMRGCDNFCSFCVVPYTRGRERSRDPQGLLREVEAAVASGHSQITLLGQNVNSYRFEDWDFARLILAVAEVSGVQRVRFTSPHPKDFPPALLDAVAGHPNICKHIHLPLQSGNDRILDLMNRTYTRREYLDLVRLIRRRHPGIALTTDIICGFCSETEEEFLDTYRVVEEVTYQSAYVFKYSERKNTIAARKYPDDIPEEVKGERVSRLVDLQRPITARYNRGLIGQTLPVMVENDSKRSSDQWMGRTDTNITVIWNKDDAPATVGSIQPITIHEANAAALMGRLVRPLAHT
ncbi:MAG: tRNA-2-methylthio-N(6)-dimethylallyladenosine synthase [Nitrospirae bacterium]|nr:MAG: isopentenyl-adenosine A37 tRNA methylthiolase MiaB [Nitrospira sp. OLB3]MBV6469070.1 tRNA-2-methylthio-N(6)-dimethylallyladenosine synthase [Nitrospirota bacterium]MCE7965961.1 tRNA (N6-isopentenyl adenosine(37)-C2)-methylthiotransferase MiaB [Nitrospira sp. NTP2]MCK6493273.1 tRNA (N6-isopentenyl adenosine(37)-C2)-methylthiotransferase MiaB [Nitrospira sp.]MEB2338452.1 tRNA (N6-isopentenyl adenosine(37)-C2)-methylthiotransferase MiaB [Nitrospirales bacterium]